MFKPSTAMKIAVLPGDGIGKEVTAEAVRVVRSVLDDKFEYEMVYGLIGGDAIDAANDALPSQTLQLAVEADAILLGGVGRPGDDRIPTDASATGSLLRLRRSLDLFANYRPAYLYPQLTGASSLKPAVIDGLDLVIIRELSSDLYFGEPRGITSGPGGERIGINTMKYTSSEVERIARVGFELARKRKGKLTSVDKANVLEAMVLWRDVVTTVGKEYPDVELTHMFVDSAAMALMKNPVTFDVLLTGNVFGDILSDAAAMLTGSIGMLASASMSYGTKGLFEPVHGTAPDIAGTNSANPLAAILSAAMMLRLSFGLDVEADRIEAAIQNVLNQGLRTADIQTPGCTVVGTTEMGEAVMASVRSQNLG